MKTVKNITHVVDSLKARESGKVSPLLCSDKDSTKPFGDVVDWIIDCPECIAQIPRYIKELKQVISGLEDVVLRH